MFPCAAASSWCCRASQGAVIESKSTLHFHLTAACGCVQMLDVHVRMYLYRWDGGGGAEDSLESATEPYHMRVRTMSP